jgi:hypothetical protein
VHQTRYHYLRDHSTIAGFSRYATGHLSVMLPRSHFKPMMLKIAVDGTATVQVEVDNMAIKRLMLAPRGDAA